MDNIETKRGAVIEIQKIWLIPVLCLIVISGALFLSSSYRGKGASQPESTAGKMVQEAETKAVFSFFPSEVFLEKQQTADFNFKLGFDKNIYLDGVDVILVFDPKIIKIEEVIPSSLFSYNVFRREDLQNGRIAVTFLEERGGGLLFKKEESLMTVSLKRIAEGQSYLSILISEKGASSVITESGTSKKILFEGKSLEIK